MHRATTKLVGLAKRPIVAASLQMRSMVQPV
jgi:hypothetical protein